MKIRNIWQSIWHAITGFVYAFRHEQNMRVHSLAAVSVVIAAFIVRFSLHDWIILILTITLVLSLELINSGAEILADVVKPRLHAQVGTMKDVMAAAVLVSSMASLIIGILLFEPYIVEILGKN